MTLAAGRLTVVTIYLTCTLIFGPKMPFTTVGEIISLLSSEKIGRNIIGKGLIFSKQKNI